MNEINNLRKFKKRKYRNPEFDIESPIKLTHDINGNDIEISDNVVALSNVPYFMGQIKEDKIYKNEICIVEQISRNGRLFFEEHPSRYGPWSNQHFIRLDKYEAHTGRNLNELLKKNGLIK